MNFLRPFLMTLLWIVVAAATITVAWSFYEKSRDRSLFSAPPGSECENLDAAQTRDYLARHPGTQILDVRSEREFRGGALPDAIHLSIGDPDFDSNVTSLDREKPVLVYCAGGVRSRQAVARMKPLGFRKIRHLHRGYYSWKSGR